MKFEIPLPSFDQIAEIVLLLTATQQCFVFQSEGNEHREHIRYTKLFCLIPNFQVDNLEKKNYLKKGIEFTVSESSIYLVFFNRLPRIWPLRNVLQRIIVP